MDNAALPLDLNVFEKDLTILKVGQTTHFTLTNNLTNEHNAEIFIIGGWCRWFGYDVGVALLAILNVVRIQRMQF